jgi:hypothetical protein
MARRSPFIPSVAYSHPAARGDLATGMVRSGAGAERADGGEERPEEGAEGRDAAGGDADTGFDAGPDGDIGGGPEEVGCGG